MLSIGIVGLPNTGKSTLFNALVRAHQAKVALHPFTTIKPNVGVVEVPDDRLSLVADRLSLPKKIPATIEFVDIAGLVKGAHKGEGLGNQFLAHIREGEAILHLVRFFDESIPYPEGMVVDPESDYETVNTELILKDFETLNKAKKEKDQKKEKKSALLKIENIFNQDKMAKEVDLTKEEKESIEDLNFLTLKPTLVVANIQEGQIENPPKFKNALPICAKLEAELIELREEERNEYLKSLGITESGLERVIKEAYKLLNLMTFYTLLPNQVQAWPVEKGTKAKEAAGKIHTDFEKKFIACEVCPVSELVKFSSWQEAHQKGKVKEKGKEYLMQDADVVYFKHG